MTDDEPGFRVLSIFDDEAVVVGGGGLRWVPVRRRLGVAALGVNAFRAGQAGDAVVEDHVESPGQEELYVVVRGSARLVVGGAVVDAPAGSAVFVPHPHVTRSGVRSRTTRSSSPSEVGATSRTTRCPGSRSTSPTRP